MKSENYRTLLNNEYKNQELSADDFDNTLIHFAKLYHAEQLRLGAVVGRSEQLKAFVRWVKANDRYIVDGDFGLIDDYLKNL